jgi:hypothetical protein
MAKNNGDNRRRQQKRENTANQADYRFTAALNVTHGEHLAWQERKAESFVFTPRYCGFDFPEMHLHPDLPESYRPTYAFAYPRSSSPELQKEIGGVHVGTAMSISGAAASPNMGYHTSPPLAFLMTMFDVRLGWWLPNPRHASEEYAFKRPEGGPRVSLLYLLHELFASTTDRSKYVYVSDGGHFENLAIYELVLGLYSLESLSPNETPSTVEQLFDTVERLQRFT